jgi:hypothetical protein
MRQPEVYTPLDLKNWNVDTRLTDGRYVPARPMGHNLYGFVHRWKLAWRVFTGKLDTVDWQSIH